MARKPRQIDDDEAVAALVVEPPSEAPAISADDAQEANARVREREWSRQLDRDMQKQMLEREDRYRALLLEDFGEDAANRIMRVLSPILKAGRDYGRRERVRLTGPTKAT